MILNKIDKKRFGNTKWNIFFVNPIYRYIYLFRVNKKVTKLNPLFLIYRIWFKNISVKYNIQIPIKTKIGSGLFINHFGGIIVNHDAVIGENCNICQGVTIGNTSRGKFKGTPKIGNRVYIGANSVVVGQITIGNDVLIAPLSYVNFDIPDNAVVMGNPAKIVSYNTSAEYIKNIN